MSYILIGNEKVSLQDEDIFDKMEKADVHATVVYDDHDKSTSSLLKASEDENLYWIVTGGGEVVAHRYLDRLDDPMPYLQSVANAHNDSVYASLADDDEVRWSASVSR